MLSAPYIAWLMPATRVRCSLGTINAVDDCIAGQWKIPPSSRASMMMYTCHTWMPPDQNRYASHNETPAIALSATIIVTRRFHRSTYTPAIGPSTICGSMANRVAVANTVAEPVSAVSHQIRANIAMRLPVSDSACPVQIVKNGRFQLALASMYLSPDQMLLTM